MHGIVNAAQTVHADLAERDADAARTEPERTIRLAAQRLKMRPSMQRRCAAELPEAHRLDSPELLQDQ